MVLTPESVSLWERQLDSLRRGHLRPGRSVHLVGIGGIGMAGIALHLHARGLRVTGSELVSSRVTAWLADHDIPLVFGHAAENIPSNVDWVIKTPAVQETNPEIERARLREIPVFTRGVVLPALLDDRRSVAVSGTHGKTTTSSMIAQILVMAGISPSHCIGGEIDRLGGVAGVGEGSVLVVEADESDGTLVLYEPDLGVLTNVEYDHMEHFSGQAEFLDCFRQFVRRCKRLVYCVDDPAAFALGKQADDGVGYGKGSGAAVSYGDYRVEGLCSSFTLTFPDRTSCSVRLEVPGEHQACNATGAAAAAWTLGVGTPAIVRGLQSFQPARRRFEVTVQGAGLTVVSDYAHHPTEIRALVDASRERHAGRILAVYQPHRYTRTQALIQAFPAAFAGLDQLILVPVYAASELPLPGGTSADLLARIQDAGSVPVQLADSLDQAWLALQALRRPGDLVLIVGAGDVEELAHRAWPEDASI